jgi:hypothetical protein
MLQRTQNNDGEAVLRYGDYAYDIVRPGQFVRCAVSGEKIPVEDLRYWNAELQEAYRGPAEALKRWQALKNKT